MDFLSGLVGDVVGDVVADKAGKGLRRVLGRRGPADGGAGCALKIISGSQDGLSRTGGWAPRSSLPASCVSPGTASPACPSPCSARTKRPAG